MQPAAQTRSINGVGANIDTRRSKIVPRASSEYPISLDTQYRFSRYFLHSDARHGQRTDGAPLRNCWLVPTHDALSFVELPQMKELL